MIFYFIFLFLSFFCSPKKDKNIFYKVPYQIRLQKKYLKIRFEFNGKEKDFIIKTDSRKGFNGKSEKFKKSFTKRYSENN